MDTAPVTRRMVIASTSVGVNHTGPAEAFVGDEMNAKCDRDVIQEEGVRASTP